MINYDIKYKEACDFITMECTPKTRNFISWNEGSSPKAIENRLLHVFHDNARILLSTFVLFLEKEIFDKDKFDLSLEEDFRGKPDIVDAYLKAKVKITLRLKLQSYIQAKQLIQMASEILEGGNAPYVDQWDAIEMTTERINFIAKTLEPDDI